MMSMSDYLAVGGCVLVSFSIYSLLGFAALCGVVGVGLIGLAVYMARGEHE